MAAVSGRHSTPDRRRSGTKVRDLVHPTLYIYIEGRSKLLSPVATGEAPSQNHIGCPFASSPNQWLPTPHHVADNGSASSSSYINNLNRTRHAAAYDDLAALLATALPIFESVIGYVESTKVWQEECEDVEYEGELPADADHTQRPAPAKSLRGRDVLVIPKTVEYRLGVGATHEGVWHVEGMSHEHIIATCVYILERDDELEGGERRFKRACTVEEAGRLFWNISQCRPCAVERLVDEGFIPVGSVATPTGRLLVFPNSHVHRLSVVQGATEGRCRVIVFWIVDPNVTIASMKEVSQQQGVIPHEEALALRLELMKKRRRHKQTFNVRAVSLCEHQTRRVLHQLDCWA